MKISGKVITFGEIPYGALCALFGDNVRPRPKIEIRSNMMILIFEECVVLDVEPILSGVEQMAHLFGAQIGGLSYVKSNDGSDIWTYQKGWHHENQPTKTKIGLLDAVDDAALIAEMERRGFTATKKDTYWVTYRIDGRVTFEVQANSVEEAKQAAEYAWQDADFGVLEDIDGEPVSVSDEQNIVWEK